MPIPSENLWYLLNGKTLCKVTEACFHPIDDKRIISSSQDKIIRM